MYKNKEARLVPKSVHETCSQANCISLHVTQTPVKLWRGQQPLNQTDKSHRSHLKL